MELQHINAKLLVKNSAGENLEPLIPIFHGWIKERAFDELLLDVADYRHVCGGPGVVLIGQAADYSVDDTDNRWGVRYNRKAALDGSNQDRLQQAARSALIACQRLEAEPSLSHKIAFNGQEMEFFVNDRMLAPNRPATRDAVRPDFEAFFKRLFRGGEFSLSYNDDPRRLFGMSVKTSQAFSIADLLANLGA